MNIKQLHKICEKAINKGFGNNKIYFDTEASTFKVHMVEVSDAYIEPLDDNNLLLYYDRKPGVIEFKGG